MILRLGDDGVVSSVDEEELVYADKKELEKFIDSYHNLENENRDLKRSYGKQMEEIECLSEENKQLKSALLFYLDVATGLSSSSFDKDMDKWCEILLDCNYEKAKKEYGDFKYAARWEIE